MWNNHRYVCDVSTCVCLYVCGGADVAWMMGLESWCCRAAVRTWTEPVDMVLVVTGRVLYVVGWAAAYYVRCCGGGLC